MSTSRTPTAPIKKKTKQTKLALEREKLKLTKAVLKEELRAAREREKAAIAQVKTAAKLHNYCQPIVLRCTQDLEAK